MLDDADMLNISPSDNLNRDQASISLEEVTKKAADEKAVIDAEFEKIAAAADAAKARIHQ